MCICDWCDVIPKRNVILTICVLTNASVYAVRILLPMTIASMLVQSDLREQPVEKDAQPWSEWTIALLLASFYIGNIIGQLPFTWLLERLGTRLLLGVSMVVAGASTACIPRAGLDIATTQMGWVCGMRAISGLACSAALPSFQLLLRMWLGPSQYQSAALWLNNGATIGTFGGIMISGLIAHYCSWEYVYYSFGGFCVLCGLIYMVAVRDDYEYYPGIQVGEVRLLRNSGAAPMDVPTPWWDIFTSGAVWAIIFAQIGHSAVYYLFQMIMPLFMAHGPGLELHHNTFFQAVAWLVLWISSLLTVLLEARFLEMTEHLSTRCTRLIFNTVATLPSALFLGLVVGLVELNKWAVMSMLCLVMLFRGANIAGFRANIHDITDNYAAELVAVANLIGLMVAIVLPFVWGATVSPWNGGTEEYRPLFFGTAGVMLLGNALFALMCSDQVQWWDGVSLN